MKEIFMSSGILTAIVLSFIGIIKLPFKNFKTKHPKLFKALFTIASLVVTFAVCLGNQYFILNDKILSTDFVVMLLFTYAGVFGLYNSYEGLGLKVLVKKLFTNLKTALAKNPDNKISKYIDKVGIDKILEIVNQKQSEPAVVEVETNPVEEVKTNVENVPSQPTSIFKDDTQK